MAAMLELHEVQKRYQGRRGAVQALDGVVVAVGTGEFVAIQGPSGCGKTTLLLVAGALLAPDRGSVMVDGRDPYALSPDARARFRAEYVGFVFQQFHLVPYLTVLDNVLAPALALRMGDARTRAHELLDRFGMKDRLHHLPAALSTGERQRVALARALLHRPKLLLADEPTGNLDSANAEVVMDTLAAFAREGGAVLLVTHDPRAASYAHRTVAMVGGRAI